MRSRLLRLSMGTWIAAWTASGVFAQKTLTWEDAKREFEAANPTLRAGRIGIQESRADEVTAYLRPNPDLTVMLVGRSGGGWTSFMYAALDERIHYAVSVAGGMPMSHWGHDKPLHTADYEQLDPLIFESVRYEDIMPVAGSRGAFYVYIEHDPCCFRLSPDDPFLRYLQSAAVALHKPIGVYVDRETTTDSFSEAAVDAMDAFVAVTNATHGIPAATATPARADGDP
jgi:pimeloyl-ACP methyl ester carboxylesterase